MDAITASAALRKTDASMFWTFKEWVRQENARGDLNRRQEQEDCFSRRSGGYF